MFFKLNYRFLLALPVLILLGACATSPTPAPACPEGQSLAAHGCAPLGAVEDPFINEIFDRRTWKTQEELGADPVQFGAEVELPVNRAFGKIIDHQPEDARNAFVVKLWLIENAQHTVDVVYYIFASDMAGYAMIGALCSAVQRGVDVRLTIDGTGSMSAKKPGIRALKRCEDRAGFVRNANGELTTRRARVQLMTFNAVSNFKGSPNRRSHDKLLVIDGAFPEKAYAMTGGRNISLDYYGFKESGEIDQKAYMDMEILLRADPDAEGHSIGDVSEVYYSLLFWYRGNQPMLALSTPQAQDIYRAELARAYDALRSVKAMPLLQPHWADMPQFTTEGFHPTDALLSHELTNLDNKRVVREAAENLKKNPNSVLFVLDRIEEERDGRPDIVRIVSPYLFLAQYKDADGNIVVDEAESILKWLAEHPEARLEIMTNSVVTSDNFPAQSVIDFNTAPRLLLAPGLRDAWLSATGDQERTSALTQSVAWREQVNHPRLKIYETGKLDSDYFEGGDVTYGKLHSKFFLDGDIAFVGTNNLDYRSRLYNNEMGYFLHSDPILDDLNAAFDDLIEKSYVWGSPEWLEMRAQAMQIKGMKGWSTRHQRKVYRTLRATGLDWLF